MNKCDTLLHASIIVTQNSSRDILYDNSIAITQGRIVEIGATNEIKSQWDADQELDLRGMLVMPGLINAHTHAAMTFLRGKADDQPLLRWLQETVFPLESRLSPEIVYWGTLLGYAEMLATGTTACIDMYIFEDAVLKAAEVAGIRCLGGEAVFNFPSAKCQDYRQALEQTALLAQEYACHPRIQVAVNPHSVYTTTPDILQDCARLAENLNLPIHIHLAETSAETAQCMEMQGLRPVEYLLKHIGDNRIIAAHLVDITEFEAKCLAMRGVTGVHNPSSNLKLASGIAPVQHTGSLFTWALGTDGAASNNQLNMFMEMRLAALLQKNLLHDPEAMPAQQVLDMATLNGAIALGYDDLGSLAPGYRADCIALDLSLPNLQPMHNPVSQIVYAATGNEVQMTMVEGDIVYNRGNFAGFDFSALLKEADKLKNFAEMR